MSSIINRKARRQNAKIQQKTNTLNIDKMKQEITKRTIDKTQAVLISAMLLALNSKLGIGAKRGNEILEEINSLIENNTTKDLQKKAQEKFKIKIK